MSAAWKKIPEVIVEHFLNSYSEPTGFEGQIEEGMYQKCLTTLLKWVSKAN